MGIQTVKQFKAWSFTRWSDYETCPAMAKYKHLDKLPAPQHPAAARGADVAQRTEDWLNGDLKTMPVELKPLAAEYRTIKRDKATKAEAFWGFTKDWEPCATNDWNRCWLRTKIDIHRVHGTTLLIDDNKTGKFSEYAVEKYKLQLDLYAASGTIIYPKVTNVVVRLLFSDLGLIYPKTEPATYTRAQTIKARKAWDKRTKAMLSDTRFAPRPSHACRWCPYSKTKGGPCKY